MKHLDDGVFHVLVAEDVDEPLQEPLSVSLEYLPRDFLSTDRQDVLEGFAAEVELQLVAVVVDGLDDEGDVLKFD